MEKDKESNVKCSRGKIQTRNLEQITGVQQIERLRE